MKTLAAALFFATLTAQAEVKLPAVLADHMVLQRDKPVHLWGTATAGEKVHAEFRNHHADTTADARGNWSITLPKGDAGGSFVLTLTPSSSPTSSSATFGSPPANPTWSSPSAATPHAPARCSTCKRKSPTSTSPTSASST